MAIETDARKFIVQACKYEAQIQLFEQSLKTQWLKDKKGSRSDHLKGAQEKMCGVLGQINSVANLAGQGRDHFQAEVLFQCEELKDHRDS
jgi:hypothetical protein